MFNTIIVGTDGSPDAEEAVRVASDLAAASPDASLHVVTAFRPTSAPELRQIAEQLPEEYRDLLHAHFAVDTIADSARSIARIAGVEPEVQATDADPTDALLDAAERLDADVLVVGSRGEGPAKRALHGSVSTKLVHHAPCSVLVVRARENP